MNKNILIRGLTEEDNSLLEHIRNLLGEKANSRTVLKMIRNYTTVKSDLETVIGEYLKMKQEYFKMSDTLNGIREALGMKRIINWREWIVIENGQRKI
jgi:hypothetical protein